MQTIRVSLDWLPNSNHAGLYVALAKNFYREVGLDVKLNPPSADYSESETPARQVVNGAADICVCPSESLISCWTSDSGDPNTR